MNSGDSNRMIRELVARIDEVRSLGEKAQAVSKAAAERESTLRGELLAHMQATGTRHALVGDVSAIIRTVRKVEVTNEDALTDKIAELGTTHQYMEFNLARAKADGAQNAWPGVETRESEQLVISKSEREA